MCNDENGEAMLVLQGPQALYQHGRILAFLHLHAEDRDVVDDEHLRLCRHRSLLYVRHQRIFERHVKSRNEVHVGLHAVERGREVVEIAMFIGEAELELLFRQLEVEVENGLTRLGDVLGNLYGKDALADIAVGKEATYLMLKPELAI